jgi:hypothetical protein
MDTWAESAQLGGLATPFQPVCARSRSSSNGRALTTLARPVARGGAARPAVACYALVAATLGRGGPANEQRGWNEDKASPGA